MSVELSHNGTFNLSKLFDELLVAGLVPPTVDGCSPCQGAEGGVRLTVPDGADETAIAVVVAAHDPTPAPAVDPDTELDAAIRSATTLAGLKAALLGSRGGRVKARPGA